MTVEVSICIAVIGCLVGLAGWLSNRDKGVARDAEWRGMVNAKLDIIVGLRSDMDRLSMTVSEHGERLSKVESGLHQLSKHFEDVLKGGDKL